MADRPASNRRYALIASIFVVVLLLVVFASLFDSCGEANETEERIAPSEEVVPPPGVQ